MTSLSYQKLLQAGKELARVDGPSALASWLTQRGFAVTEQKMTNWKTRGVSQAGIIEAARLLGCRASWLASGEGEMTDTLPALPANLARLTPPPDPLITQALALLEATDHDGRVMALTAIKFALKDHRPAQSKTASSSG